MQVCIAVVERDKMALQAITDILEANGHLALPYTVPKKALAALEDVHFDVMLTSFELGELSGISLAEQSKLIRPRLPVVLTDGVYAFIGHQSIDAFVQQPFSGIVLENVIQMVCQTKFKE